MAFSDEVAQLRSNIASKEASELQALIDLEVAQLEVVLKQALETAASGTISVDNPRFTVVNNHVLVFTPTHDAALVAALVTWLEGLSFKVACSWDLNSEATLHISVTEVEV